MQERITVSITPEQMRKLRELLRIAHIEFDEVVSRSEITGHAIDMLYKSVMDRLEAQALDQPF